MKKEPSLIKKLKEEIKDLQGNIRYKDIEIGRLDGKLEKVERLTEIIRWLVNPSTAEKKLSPKQEEILRRGY